MSSLESCAKALTSPISSPCHGGGCRTRPRAFQFGLFCGSAPAPRGARVVLVDELSGCQFDLRQVVVEPFEQSEQGVAFGGAQNGQQRALALKGQVANSVVNCTSL